MPHCSSTRALTDNCMVPADRAWPKDSNSTQKSGFSFPDRLENTENGKWEKSQFEFDQPSANYCCWSYLPTFARCAVPLELPLLFCWASHGFKPKWLWNGLYSKWTGTWAAFCIKRNESFSQKMAKRCQLDITNWHHIKAQQCMALHLKKYFQYISNNIFTTPGAWGKRIVLCAWDSCSQHIHKNSVWNNAYIDNCFFCQT